MKTLVSTHHQSPVAQYVHHNKVQDLKVDGELEPQVKDLFQQSAAAVDSHEISLLEPKNLKTLTDADTFEDAKVASGTWEPLKLDLGAGEREYDVRSDKEGNLRITDADHFDLTFQPQVITVNKYGNRVNLSTLVPDGEDYIVQDVKMNRTKSGNFYGSEETLGINIKSMTDHHIDIHATEQGYFATQNSI